jgi:hypothetical protein
MPPSCRTADEVAPSRPGLDPHASREHVLDEAAQFKELILIEGVRAEVQYFMSEFADPVR